MNHDPSPAWLAENIVNARNLGRRDADLLRAVNTDDFVTLHPGFHMSKPVYEQLSWRAKRTAHAVAVGTAAYKAVLVGRSAARTQGMWVVNFTPETVEIANPHGYQPPRRDRVDGITYRSMILLPEDYHRIGTCRATTPARTAIDIARFHGATEGAIACDWALAHGWSKADLEDQLRGLGRVRGSGSIRRAIELAERGVESPFETYIRIVLIDEGFTDIVVQAVVGPYRVDVVVNGVLIIEIDGDVKYSSDAEVAEVLRRESKREKYLRNRGYWVLRFTPRDLLKHRDRVLQLVKDALREHVRAESPKPWEPIRQG
ncbi:endonuclease domain-containing protein [Corynebacterium cystitidis]|uniref:endonuclease domain-containing protein n=1 Tax=Corynebacterium cystitidis TaxID=35757 RepID=UPI00211E05DB|nr:DUF559 domain-containing protein [Corynebacterium cystitidis]